MVTINISDETKERFKRIKLNISAINSKDLSEEKIINILLDKFEECKNENLERKIITQKTDDNGVFVQNQEELSKDAWKILNKLNKKNEN